MKSQGLQELVKNIFSDEKTKAQFVLNPDSVLTQFSLTENEKKALLKTYKLALATPDSSYLEEAVDPNTWWASPIP